jgi:hypothetical protein
MTHAGRRRENIERMQIVPWPKALALLHISKTTAYKWMQRDPEFARLRRVIHRGPTGRPRFGVFLPDLEAFIAKMERSGEQK